MQHTNGCSESDCTEIVWIPTPKYFITVVMHILSKHAPLCTGHGCVPGTSMHTYNAAHSAHFLAQISLLGLHSYNTLWLK